MKSLLNEALARHQEAEAKEERESEKAKAVLIRSSLARRKRRT